MKSSLALGLLAALLVAAPGDLRPRDGSGWSGFGKGTWVKVKKIDHTDGKLAISIQTTRLLAIGKQELSLELTHKNTMGMESKHPYKVRTSGEAAVGEKEKVASLEPESVTAAGKEFECTVTKNTVTGGGGRREITIWEAREPRLMVKRVVKTYGLDGKLAGSVTLTLAGLRASRTVKGKSVSCLQYETESATDTMQPVPGKSKPERIVLNARGTLYLSPEIPGNTVYETQTITDAEKRSKTVTREVVDFECR